MGFSEIEKKCQDIYRKSYKLDRQGGLTKLYKDSADMNRKSPMDFLSKSDCINMLTEEEWNGQKFAALATPYKTCLQCGAAIPYSDRGNRLCTDCRLSKRIDRDMNNCTTIANTQEETEPSTATVQFLPEGEQNTLSRFHVLSMQDILAHAPDRAIVFVQINNNYYGETNDR